MTEPFKELSEALIDGDIDAVKQHTDAAVAAGHAPHFILDKGLLAGMDVVGQRFRDGDLFIPEVLRCAKAMHGAMGVLRPLLIASGAPSAGTFVIGTVEGDLHDIGKNLVGMMFEGAGFNVIDLGIDIKTAAFLEAVQTHKPELLGLSALLTTTMPRMTEIITALKEAGLRDQLKVIVGGAPVTSAFAEQIGADAYATSAVSAVETGRKLLGMGRNQ